MPEDGPILLTDLVVDERTARVGLSDGRTLELAAGSLPPALPALGEVLAPELLFALEEAAQRKQAAKLVFRMLDRRLHTRRDLERKLADKGFSTTAIGQVLDRFAEQGLMSDRRYAEAWCRDTLRAKAVGRRYLVSKLRGKGIAAALSEAVVAEELDAETEEALARRAAGQWLKKFRGVWDYKAEVKGRRFLTGRGFAPGQAAAALRDALRADEEGEA